MEWKEPKMGIIITEKSDTDTLLLVRQNTRIWCIVSHFEHNGFFPFLPSSSWRFNTLLLEIFKCVSSFIIRSFTFEHFWLCVCVCVCQFQRLQRRWRRCQRRRERRILLLCVPFSFIIDLNLHFWGVVQRIRIYVHVFHNNNNKYEFNVYDTW